MLLAIGLESSYTMNPLIQLQQFGQSPWYDYIRRDLIISGELTALIENDGLLGITSNPSIFEKAIGGTTQYDDLLKTLHAKPIGVKECYETLAIRDIQDAADLLFPVYEKTNAVDGYVSLEVSPNLAYDTEGTIEEALRLFKTVNRPNVMIKVPGTAEGVPAIERLIIEGLSINVTLLFSVKRYEEVALAYLSGLQKRVDAGLDIRKIASVASFFISRIDTLIDTQLTATSDATTDPIIREKCQALLGKVAIANAKVAYAKFREISESTGALALAKKGGQAQRLLWASTSTKNPKYKDTYYVETLIGKETVNTLPTDTFRAFRDHGIVENTLTTNLLAARQTLTQLADCGIDLSAMTDQLLADGVSLFAKAFDQLMATLYKKQYGRLIAGPEGEFKSLIELAVKKIKQDKIVERIWKKDATVWLPQPSDLPLGWLNSIETEIEAVSHPGFFLKSDAFQSVVLLGMGGSSLCPKLLHALWGSRFGYPKFYLLDTILPSAIESLEQQISLSETVFIVSSKSGTTIESITLCQYFLNKLSSGDQFIAITDPESQLATYARENRFRAIFSSSPDIGGRYSALSPSGLIPAAMMGIDIQSLLNHAQKIKFACGSDFPSEENAAVQLGATIGQLAKSGRDKLTFITSSRLRPFEYWLEQLIAESTGKDGVGIVPIVDEPLAPPHFYSHDRAFVYIRYQKEADPLQDKQVADLEQAGQPVMTIEINDLAEIGGQFFLWEMATAVAGSILRVNPFDQPNVEESKINTRALLESDKNGIFLSTQKPNLIDEGIAVFTNEPIEGISTLKEFLAFVMNQTRLNDYIAINAYLPETDQTNDQFRLIRNCIRQKKQLATTFGYGPSYLHSTGQIQKGGGNRLLVLIITSDIMTDLPIPNRSYSFGQLVMAEAIGDFESLCQLQRRVVRIHLGADIDRGLNALVEGVS